MICYRDISFCAEGDTCQVRIGCNRHFSDEEKDKAAKWWGGDDYPVCFAPMAETCERRKEGTT